MENPTLNDFELKELKRKDSVIQSYKTAIQFLEADKQGFLLDCFKNHGVDTSKQSTLNMETGEIIANKENGI